MTRQSKTQLQRKNEFDGSLVFGTRTFNQITGRDKQVDYSTKQVRDFFVDPQTGLLYDHMAEYRDCTICGGREFKTLFIKNGFRHVKCSCGFIFVSPTASDKYRNEFFSKETDETWIDVLLTSEQELIDSRKFRYGLEFIESHVTGTKGLLVDIGAGTGLFLKVARSAGWKVSGVEFNPKAVKAIRKLGIEVSNRPMDEEIYTPESVDVVTVWEVLEHINKPNEFIEQLRHILKPRGLLFVCVPNINALVTRILHQESGTFDGSAHVNFFSIETLSRLLGKHGLQVLETDTAISELGTIKNYLAYEEPYSGEGSLELDFLTPEYLYTHNLGSRIFMLARKN